MEFIYLSVPHGTDKYINEQMEKSYIKLQKKLLNIMLINNTQIKLQLLKRFMNYNKIIYQMKNCRIVKDWIIWYDELYLYIQRSITSQLTYKNTMQYQIQMTKKRGGMGLRSPLQFYCATKISTLSGKLDKVQVFFDVGDEDDDEDMDDEIKFKLYRESIKRYKNNYHQYIEDQIFDFNNFIGPDLHYVYNKQVKHRDLLELIDLKLLDLFYQNGDIYDKARIKSLSVNGATSWLDVVPNNIYGVKYDNQEMWVLLSLFFGCDISNKDKLCFKCKQPTDRKGYHALHCPKGPHVIQRHNKIRDKINKYMKQSGLNTKIEQKYKYDENKQEMIDNNGKVPGDILAYNFDDGNNYYFDVVVGNVFAKSYINNTSKTRLFLANDKENKKISKYKDIQYFIPLAIEVMGAIGDKIKYIIQNLADKLAKMKKIKYEIMMNRIRKNIIAILMKHNAKMIISSLLID